eukprot:182906_1
MSGINLLRLSVEESATELMVPSQLSTMANRKEIVWTKDVFSLDVKYAITRPIRNQTIRIYQCNSDFSITNCPKSSEFVTEFLGVDKNSSSTICKIAQDIDYTLVGIGYTCYSYSINIENLRILKQQIPIWMIAAIKNDQAICQCLMGQVNIINNHLYVKQCAATLSYNCIDVICDMFVFGLDLKGKLSLQKENDSFKVSVKIASEKDKSIGMN